MLHPGPTVAGQGTDPAHVISVANHAYLEAHRRNARLMALLEQVATMDAAFQELRRKRTEVFPYLPKQPGYHKRLCVASSLPQGGVIEVNCLSLLQA
jgi:hypothetical protein